MALTVDANEIRRLIAMELAPQVRYRVLVMQCADMAELGNLVERVSSTLQAIGKAPRVFDFSDFFDSVGAISCEQAWDRIESAASQPLILAGPLHFLDYWSEATRDVFWRSLASYSSGSGIVVIDAPRNEGIEGPFRLIGRIADSEIRLLKSRLSVVQDR